MITDNKIYKPQNTNNNNMLPGDRNGSPDESFNSTVIFIDAGFLEKVSKFLGDKKYLKFNRLTLIKNLTKRNNLVCSKIFYYTAPPFQSNNPSKDEKKKKIGYDKFIKKLRQENIIVREGRCQRLKTGKNFEYHQKAVDILLTIDLMELIHNNPPKKIILISSDSDFVPVIKKLEQNNIKTILYTYYTKKRNTKLSRSNHLIKSVHKYVVLTKQDFDEAPLIK